ncbi:mutator-like element [Purpureocillium lilacinum]|uniref:Mutator-like element n=1 Tax=Purpureocillium lilacinum TaxID=33203 RepID=A0A179F5X0_PURLI|nr:mutator-like element [Purpureocillium lilacinum]
MWKRFPEVISFDNTYNTNRFKLPLFQATGQTCLGSISNAAFGLIDNDRHEGFQFLSESIRQLLEQHSICQPDVIITDFDDQMIAALNDQFPGVQQQLCFHHINSNVLLKSKQKWVESRENSSSIDSSDGNDYAPPAQAKLSPKARQLVNAPAVEAIPHNYQGVLMMWKLVLFAESKHDHEKAWKNLCREFDDQRAILPYLHGTYMPVRPQWARCFIRKYRNFGIRVTSGTEASNNNVKSYLLNGMSHLYRLVEAMRDIMKDQERDFNDALAADEVLTAREYIGPSAEYLGELRTAISSKGLELIKKQYRLARKAMPTGKNPFPEPLGDCDDDCSVSVELASRQWGVPRATLYDRTHGRECRKDAFSPLQRLSQTQEIQITEWILIQDALGLPPTHSQIKQFAQRMLAVKGDHVPLGKHWMQAFLRRNPAVRTQKCHHKDSACVNGASTEAIKPEHRYNMDEAGIMEGLGENGNCYNVEEE